MSVQIQIKRGLQADVASLTLSVQSSAVQTYATTGVAETYSWARVK